jgi:hypothetical protein
VIVVVVVVMVVIVVVARLAAHGQEAAVTVVDPLPLLLERAWSA